MDATEFDSRFETLLRDSRGGSHEAIGELLELCRERLMNRAERELSSKLRPKFGASDVVQETLVDAVRLFDQFEGRDLDELLAWLRTILMNRLGNLLQRYQSLKREIDRESPIHDGRKENNLLEDLNPTAHDLLARMEQGDAIRRALERLSETSRQVLILRTWEHLSFEEIGRKIGRSADASRKIWRRAIDRLDAEMKDCR